MENSKAFQIITISEAKFSIPNLNIINFSNINEINPNEIKKIAVLLIPQNSLISHLGKKKVNEILQLHPYLQLIIQLNSKTSSSDLKEILNQFKILYCLENSDFPNLEKYLITSLEKAIELEQKMELSSLIKEHHLKLNHYYIELEDRINKRQVHLNETRNKYLISNEKWQLILHATEVVQQSNSLSDLESKLLNVLSDKLQIQGTRIFSTNQSNSYLEQVVNSKQLSSIKIPLYKGESEVQFGDILFFRLKNLPFRKDEIELLHKVSDVVSLAVDRLHKLEQIIELKNQWQVTFNAIKDPVILINSSYEIIQHNQPSKVVADKCYKFLFQRESPCLNCKIGERFRIEQSRNEIKTIDVNSQEVTNNIENQKIFVNQYKDITEQLKIEKKIIESAQLAEIGTIGSSIAHELNNPLGGMLSFAQLIKMDIKQDDSIYSDILDLEDGIKRCRDIVQNLLGFSRHSKMENKNQIEVNSVIEKALKIMEIQYRALGIDVKFTRLKENHYVEGFENHLVQSFQNILQTIISGIQDQIKKNKIFKGIIEVNIKKIDKKIIFEFFDNGVLSELQNPLSLSIAKQIIYDHNGSFEMMSQQKPFKSIKVTFIS